MYIRTFNERDSLTSENEITWNSWHVTQDNQPIYQFCYLYIIKVLIMLV